MSGYFLAAASVASPRAKPTVTITSYFSSANCRDVLGVVLGVGRLDVLDFRAQILSRLLHAFPGRLVERLVVDLADVRHQTDLQLLHFRGLLELA